RVESSMFSTSPAPNMGVGIRKMMLLFCWACLKFGCCRLQRRAPALPETVKNASTPPFGALLFGTPWEFAKKGKRATSVGPWAVMNEGMVLVEPDAIPCVMAWNCGLFGGLLPPTAGCAWHPEQLLKLKRGPSPLFAPPDTTSSSWKRPRPLS